MAEVDPNQEAALRRLRAAFGFSGDVGYWNCLNARSSAYRTGQPPTLGNRRIPGRRADRGNRVRRGRNAAKDSRRHLFSQVAERNHWPRLECFSQIRVSVAAFQAATLSFRPAWRPRQPSLRGRSDGTTRAAGIGCVAARDFSGAVSIRGLLVRRVGARVERRPRRMRRTRCRSTC